MNLANQKQNGVKIYDMITDHAEKKLMNLTHKLGIDKFAYETRNKWAMTFFDTPDNLLTKTGILLYRTMENDKYYFKMEKLNFLPSTSRLRKQSNIFTIDAAAHDTPKEQAFYIINGITEMFSTQFFIDLENVVKVAVPKLQVDIVGRAWKGFRGDGFKCIVEFQKVKYKNLVTKRKFSDTECTVSQISGKSFDDEFEDFIGVLERYCKDILPQKTSRYEKGMRMTQVVPKAPRAKKEKKKKEKKIRIEDRIEG